MINIWIEPVLLRWGTMTLPWHGLLLAAGVLVVYAGAIHEGTRQGFSRQSLSEMALWMLFPSFAGARLLGVLREWPAYACDPARILTMSGGGLTVTGGLLGGIAVAVVYARRRGLDGWKLLDILAVAVPPGYIVGRVGCIINGDVCGLPTGGKWGLVYWNPRASIPAELLGVPTFPAPIALQVWSAVLLVLLLVLRRRAPYNGLLFSIYLVGYGAGRVIINIWQAGEPVIAGLKFTQIVNLGLILLGAASLAYLLGTRGWSGAKRQRQKKR